MNGDALKRYLVVDPEIDWDYDRVYGDYETLEEARKVAGKRGRVRHPFVVAKVIYISHGPNGSSETLL